MVNKLITGSYVNITFPNETSLNTTTSSCTITNNTISATCTVVSSNIITITLSQVVNGGSNLTLTVTKVTNPLLTSPSSSFTIYSYYVDDSSVVDQLATGLSISASERALRSVVLTLSSYVVYASATYTFAIQPTYSLPLGTVIKITFPQQLSLTNIITLIAFTIDNIVISDCILSTMATTVNSSQLVFSSACVPGIVANTSMIEIRIGDVINPVSFKSTESFLVEAFNGVYRQEYIGSGVTVTMNQTTTV